MGNWPDQNHYPAAHHPAESVGQPMQLTEHNHYSTAHHPAESVGSPMHMPEHHNHYSTSQHPTESVGPPMHVPDHMGVNSRYQQEYYEEQHQIAPQTYADPRFTQQSGVEPSYADP